MEDYDHSYNVVDYNVSAGGNYNGGGENLEKANNPSQTLWFTKTVTWTENLREFYFQAQGENYNLDKNYICQPYKIS